jgi:hypothetical protein
MSTGLSLSCGGMLLLISYDLDTVDRPPRYEAIKTTIEGAATEFRRPLYSQWLVVTNEGVDEWGTRLRPFLSPEDRLLIVRITGRSNGWLPEDLWTWINVHAI